VKLPLEWKDTNATAIQTTVRQLCILMDERKLNLQDALKLNIELLEGAQGTNEDFAGRPR